MSALLVIDVQNDFMEYGPFKTQNTSRVVAPINALLNRKWDLVVASRDWHPADHQSFASAHGVEPFTPIAFRSKHDRLDVPAWPDHCVQDTPGAEFHPDIDPAKFDCIIDKGTDSDVECFSAFRDIFQQAETGLAATLRQHKIRRVYIVGLVTEYCVRSTAIDAAEFGFECALITDCIAAYDERAGNDAVSEMVARGIEIITSKDLDYIH